uniref:Uncharacterized protein n=1 Tax=uncultured marine virus TaxID=186617 RepID=A0A0F7L9R2_9VIRU|nr:hypothetical protein [uncultured marine virus]
MSNATDKQIEVLMTEANKAGDYAQAALCAIALDGDTEARAECARVIADAANMSDGASLWICVSSRYDPDGTEPYQSIEEFLSMCRDCFGEAPTLREELNGEWSDDESTVLVPATADAVGPPAPTMLAAKSLAVGAR